MKFSVRFNNDLPVAEYPRLARAAEHAGFDQFWVSHDLFLRSAWIILSACAAATERIQLGTCIVNPLTQHPADIAMAAASLDELSGGRFCLGISSGAADFLGWVGIRPERPRQSVLDAVRAVRCLFQGGSPVASGWTADAYMRFPARPNIPIYIGAMSPNMLRAIGQVGDGGLPLLFPPEHFLRVAPLVAEGAHAAGRSLDDVDLAACIWCSVSTDREAAEAVLRDKIAYYGHALSDTILENLGVEHAEFEPIQHALVRERDPARARALVTPAMLRIGVVGTAHDLLARLDSLVRMGARHLSFGPPLGPDPSEAIALLGREVLPYLRNL
jgi:5,10-methylenetetrahydromethanopterin reductase